MAVTLVSCLGNTGLVSFSDVVAPPIEIPEKNYETPHLSPYLW
jgi:hypothetical protein